MAIADLSGKVALVAGGAGWLGVSMCERLAEQGASVVIADMNENAAMETANKLTSRGYRSSSFVLDAGDEGSIRAAVKHTVDTFGGLDIHVNATFAAVGCSVDELTCEQLDTTLHVNVTGAFLLARECAHAMQKGGSVVLFGSMYGLISPNPGDYPEPMKVNPIEYGIAKAAVIQMTKYLAVQWAPKGIRVNAVAPGAFPKPSVQEQSPEFIKRLSAKSPMGRIGTPAEVASVVTFLASDDASFMTGQCVSVDGGVTIW